MVYDEVYNEYYSGYMLNDTIYEWDLTNNQKRCLDIAIFQWITSVVYVEYQKSLDYVKHRYTGG